METAQKKKVTAAVVVILVIVFLAVGYAWNIAQEGQRLEEQQGIATSSSQLAPGEGVPAETVDTTDWATYQNLKYGFQFKYPASGYRIELESENSETGGTIEALHLRPDFADEPFGLTRFNVYAEMGGTQKRFASYRNVMIGGEEALRMDTQASVPNGRGSYANSDISLIKGGVSIRIFLEKFPLDSKGDAEVEAILSTFEFILPDAVAYADNKARQFLVQLKNDLKIAYEIENNVTGHYKDKNGFGLLVPVLVGTHAYLSARLGPPNSEYAQGDADTAYFKDGILCISTGFQTVQTRDTTTLWCGEI